MMMYDRFLGWERYSLHKCNDSNLKSPRLPKKKKKKKDFWGVLKLAEGQGPQYDFGGVSTFVVPQSHFGIDPHCSDQH